MGSVIKPWQTFITGILLEGCTDEQMQTVATAVFAKYPTPNMICMAEEEGLVLLFEELGLTKETALKVRRFSAEWVAGKPISEMMEIRKLR